MIQILNHFCIWGNDRYTVAPFPSCLVVWGASEQVITAIQAALAKVVVNLLSLTPHPLYQDYQ
jgi:hypothetical protein